MREFPHLIVSELQKHSKETTTVCLCVCHMPQSLSPSLSSFFFSLSLLPSSLSLYFLYLKKFIKPLLTSSPERFFTINRKQKPKAMIKNLMSTLVQIRFLNFMFVYYLPEIYTTRMGPNLIINESLGKTKWLQQ